jgi:hypothetical protein
MAIPFFRPYLEPLEPRAVPSTVNLHAGDNLQAAIDNAQPGDVLILDAGATFTGPITLPNKDGDPDQWITIESSAMDQFPASGQRVGPQDAAFMPKITSPGSGEPALQTDPGAHNYRFVGIEFLPATDSAMVFDLIDLGDGSAAQSSLSQVPYNLSIDQCYVHAWPDQELKRGIALNSASTEIVNSYISGFKAAGEDSQAIAGWNGPGPFTIDNNYIEAAGENILLGGAAAAIPNLIPSDIEIDNNLVSKPLAWDIYDTAAYQGQHWTVKNLLELKNAQDVTINGNRFENNWVDGQAGDAILFTPRGDQSGGPWVTVSDVTFTNNTVSGSTQGIDILGSDDSSASQVTENILIQNNLFEDVASGSPLWGNNGATPKLFSLLSGLAGGTDGVTIDQNVATSCQTILFAEGTHTGFVFTNNVMPHGVYGVVASGLEGSAGLDTAFPDYTFQGNTIIDSAPGEFPPDNFTGSTADENFVMQAYLTLLQRPADAAGLAAWTAALAAGESRTQMVQALEASPEYLGIQVNNLYEALLHRDADPAGLSTFTDFLARGGTVEQVAAILVGSDEYFETRGGGSNEGFLEALYQDALLRPLDASGLITFSQAVARGMTRAQIATAVFTSVEYRQDLVSGFYLELLHRNADSSGLKAFVGMMSNGYRDEDVVAALVSSAEYTAGMTNSH